MTRIRYDDEGRALVQAAIALAVERGSNVIDLADVYDAALHRKPEYAIQPFALSHPGGFPRRHSDSDGPDATLRFSEATKRLLFASEWIAQQRSRPSVGADDIVVALSGCAHEGLADVLAPVGRAPR
jgi:hypothetical protein